MKMIAMVAMLVCANAEASELPDHVYVYHDDGNINYQCASYLTYVETNGGSSITMMDCEVVSTDNVAWPVFPAQPVSVRLYGPAFKASWSENCQFVAHAMAVNRTTSTVIDCRYATRR